MKASLRPLAGALLLAFAGSAAAALDVAAIDCEPPKTLVSTDAAGDIG